MKKLKIISLLLILATTFSLCACSDEETTVGKQSAQFGTFGYNGAVLTEYAVNTAVSNVVNKTINYNSLININYSAGGEIVSFSANQYEINTITREIVKETQFQMNNLGTDGLNIKFAKFTESFWKLSVCRKNRIRYYLSQKKMPFSTLNFL